MTAVELVAADGVRLDAVAHRPQSGPVGMVIQAHGITADKDEGGMFIRLAEQLSTAGFTVLRFSYRGHGASGGTPRGVTIAGELLDLQAAVEHAQKEHPGPLSIVAASVGAVSTALSLPHLEDHLAGLVLWNPVLDLRATFVEPELPWGLDNFGPTQQTLLRTQGYLRVDGEFELGRVLFDEFALYEPLPAFTASSVPTLVIHGDADTYVSYRMARAAAAAHRNAQLHTVVGYGARVVGGIRIGPRSYVASGSVVTKDVPPEHIVTGVNQHTPAWAWRGERLRGLIAYWTAMSPP
ncbi:MAG: alpha/beta fold hydrolase [Pseudonocardiaceae bacterium]